ncbi:MAG: hypothetical protein Q4C83_03380, partial [Candidatus Saccharibacteria bacterium]|nr:hypothetical protein [Candidatus Saccharibacteria bacterium]
TQRMDAINNLDDSDPTKLQKMRSALADAILREEISAREGVDLISYSDHENIEAERLAMTQTRIQMQADFIRLMQAQNPDFNYSRDYANKIRAAVEAQSDVQADNLNTAYEAMPAEAKRAFDKFYGDIEKKDEVYRKLRHQRMRREGVRAFSRTLIVGAATQEVAALFNDNVQGIIEGIRGENADAANRTMLESMRNVFTGNGNSAPNALLEFTGSHEVGELTPEQIQELRDAGFDVNEVYNTTTHSETMTVSAHDAVGNNPEFHRSGWYDNQTSVHDLNELRAYNHGDSFSFEPKYMSSSSNGLSIEAGDIIERAQNGQIKLKLSPTIETQGNPFELTGHVEGGRVVFDVIPGSPQAEMIANSSYAYAEVVDATNNMVMATDVGSGMADTLTQTIERTSQELTGYDIVPPDGLAPRIYGTEIPMPINLHGLSARRRLQVRDSSEDNNPRLGPANNSSSARPRVNSRPAEVPTRPATNGRPAGSPALNSTEAEPARAEAELNSLAGTAANGQESGAEAAATAETNSSTYESVNAVTGNLNDLMNELAAGLGGYEQFNEFMTDNGMAGLYTYDGNTLMLDNSVERAILSGGDIDSFNSEFSSFVRSNNFQDNPFALLAFVASRTRGFGTPRPNDSSENNNTSADNHEQGADSPAVEEFRNLDFSSGTISRRHELIRNASDEDAVRMLELDADVRLHLHDDDADQEYANRLRGYLVNDRENLAQLDESGEHFRLTPVAEEFLRRNRDLRSRSTMSSRINSYEELQRAFDNYTEELGNATSEQLNANLWDQTMSVDSLGRAAELFNMPERGSKTLNSTGRRMFRRFVAQHYIADDVPREDLLDSFITAYNNGELD